MLKMLKRADSIAMSNKSREAWGVIVSCSMITTAVDTQIIVLVHSVEPVAWGPAHLPQIKSWRQ